MERFAGFPATGNRTPIPSALLGTLLMQIDSLAELKLALRVTHLLHGKRGFPQIITEEELRLDPVLQFTSDQNTPANDILNKSLEQLVRRGILLRSSQGDSSDCHNLYLLNTETNHAALGFLKDPEVDPEITIGEKWGARASGKDIFALYEDHVGMLTPLMVEELKEAQSRYPLPWIRDAFREAVKSLSGRPNWRYIERILERWDREGRNNGEPRRYSAKSDPKAYIRGWRRSRP